MILSSVSTLIRVTGLVIYLLPINFGYEAASTGNLLAIPSFLLRFGNPLPNGLIEISAHNQQVLNAAFLCGIFIASFVGGLVSDILGRKWTVVVASIICIVGILVQSFANSILEIFGGKFISSFGFGIGQAIAPVYVAEIAPDELRGFCLILVVSRDSLSVALGLSGLLIRMVYRTRLSSLVRGCVLS